MRGQFSLGTLHDNQLGTIVWKQKPTDCDDAVSQVYLGPAEIYEYTGGKIQEGLDLLGNLIVILDDVGLQERGEEVRYAGLVLRYPRDVCGRRCYATQVEDLSLCLKRDAEKLEPLTLKTGFSVDLVTQQARLGHAHLQTNLCMYDRFAIIQQDLCKVERQVLENAINTLASSGNRYALNSLLGPGHHVTTVGATAYITRCQRVQAARIKYHNCTQEIPVRLASSNNTVKFADPISFTLSNYATIIPCDPVAPPTVEPCGAQKELEPKTREFKDEDFVTGLGGNIVE